MALAEAVAKWGVVVVAAGRGTRMGTAESKQYLLLAGQAYTGPYAGDVRDHGRDRAKSCLVVGQQDDRALRGVDTAVWT